MIVHLSNGAWDPVTLSPSKSPNGFLWIYIKVSPYGQLACLKARLAIKRHTWKYSSHYCYTFSLVGKIAFVHLLPTYFHDCKVSLTSLTIGYQECLPS